MLSCCRALVTAAKFASSSPTLFCTAAGSMIEVIRNQVVAQVTWPETRNVSSRCLGAQASLKVQIHIA